MKMRSLPDGVNTEKVGEGGTDLVTLLLTLRRGGQVGRRYCRRGRRRYKDARSLSAVHKLAADHRGDDFAGERPAFKRRVA